MLQQFARLDLTSQDYLLSEVSDSQIPSQFQDTPEIDKLDCIVIDNFKSFDKKYVGPFLNFTCIIGPNGSGKSNILDALMFCFCSETSRHSLLDARELINRQGKQSFKELSKQNKVCTVQATFILKNFQKFIINRSLDAEGKEDFSVNFKNVSKKVYQNILIRKGINSNSPNYAIWQGEIDRLILKDPLQLTSLIQNLSGSIYLKKPYEEIKDKLQQIQNIIQEKTRKINKYKLNKKNLKAVKHTNEQYTKYDNQYQSIMKKIYYLRTLQKERSIEELVNEVKRVSEEEKKKINQINQLKINAQKDFAKKTELQNEMNNVMNELGEGYCQLKNVGNPANVLKVQKLKQAKEELNKKIQQIKYVEEKKKHLIQSMPEIPPTPLMQQYLKLYEQWQFQNSSLHRQVSKKKNQLLYIEGILQSKAEFLTELQQKKKKYNKKKQQKQKTVKGLKQDLKTLKQSIKLMESESTQVFEHISKIKNEYQKKNHSFEQLCASIDDLQNMVAEQAQNEREAEMLKNLSSIDGFHGALYQKIKPNSTKFDVCFSLIFTTIAKYLLCQSQQCSKKVGNRLRQIRLMKNVIILDNVSQKRTNDIRKALGKSGSMGIDIVDFDQETKGLKEYLSQFLYGKVVCEDISNAYKIRDRNIEGIKQIYTLDGNIIKKDGSISAYGNPELLKKSQKYSTSNSTLYQDIAKLNKDKIKAEAELKNLKMKFDENQLVKRNTEINQMHRKQQIVLGKLKEIETSSDKQPSLPPSVLADVKQLEKQKDKLNKNLRELEKMIESSTIFQKFIQKHKIENLQVLRNANNFEYVQKQMKKKHEINKQLSSIEVSIQKMEKEVNRKKQQLKYLQKQVVKIPEMGDKSKIEEIISLKEKQLVQIRNKLSKLTNINTLQVSFQSALPAIQAKLNYSKQKIGKDLEELAYDLGVQYKYPIEHEEIREVLNLPRKVTQTTIQSLSQKLDQERVKIQQHLDKYNSINILVNMQDDQQRIEKGISNGIEEIDEIIKERKKLTQQLQTIGKKRANMLINFVNVLKQHLNNSYAILTEQEDGSTGTVNFHLQSQDQPFEHGIYFTPTPPTKRFVYDLEQLSGGERSIASLALQYSLSLTSKSPILILDETDAFLDLGNVNRFLHLINNSMKYHKIQMIVVTHKQGLFSKSESLVGVSRPKQLNLSQVYSLRLDEN